MVRRIVNLLAQAGLVVGGVIAVAGAAMFWDSWQQTRLQRVSATVVSSGIVKSVARAVGETGSRPSWVLSVTYRYEVAGQTYTSDFFSSNPPRSSAANDQPPSSDLELRLADFPAGKQVDAFVSPAYPAKSVLEPPAAPRWNLLAIGIAITVMCGILLLR